MSERLFRTMTDADRTGVADIGFTAWHANRLYQEWFDPAVEQRVQAWLKTWVKNPKCDIVVCLDAQGRGMGSAILNELMDRMRAEGLNRARIEVAQANLRAIDLYIRQGFRETWRGVKMSETLGLPLPRILLEKPL